MTPSSNLSSASTPSGTASKRSLRMSLFLRIHFWAAMIASPFAIVAAITGIFYIFTPQIESVLYGRLDHVEVGTNRSLDGTVQAAVAAAPSGMKLKSVIPAYQPGDTVRVNFVPVPVDGKSAMPMTGEHAGHDHASIQAPAAQPAVTPSVNGGEHSSTQGLTLYLNPSTAVVLGSIKDGERFSLWARKLHSSLLQGDGWRWMIELTASWLMVMLLTGIYLWWPRGAEKGLPQAGAKGRIAWKQWHAFIGVALSVMSLVIITTGLTWSKNAGSQIRSLRDAIGQAPPQVPRSLKSNVVEGTAPITWQTAWDITRARTPDIRVQLTPPTNASGVWRASQADTAHPAKRFDLVFDSYSGQTLYFSNWSQQTRFAQATSIGIPFHRGEFGWWNQALLLVFGLGVLFSLVSGWVMYFKRRRAGLARLPRLLPGAWRATPIAAWIIAPVLLVGLPLLALSAGVVLMIEFLIGMKARAA